MVSNKKDRTKCLPVAVLCFLQLLFYAAFSQGYNPKFTRLSATDGLSQNSVFAIVKDYKGFMWFATDEGLNRYDGYKFTVYKHDPEKQESVSNNSIYDLMEDTQHNLWVLTADGMDKFDRASESFLHYKTGTGNVIFSTIFQDSKKRIWLGSPSSGFCLFDVPTGKFKFYKKNEKDSNSLSQNYVFKITEDNYGELWIGTREGLNRFNPETEKFVQYHNNPKDPGSLSSGYIKTVYKDTKGNIWIGTQGSGIALFNRQSNTFTNYKHSALDKSSLCYNDILSFAEDANGKLWVGTENGGISVFDYSSKKFESFRNTDDDPSSISGNSVYSLFKDDIGNMWAGTWLGGINFLPRFGDKFKHYKKIPNNSNSLSSNLVLSINGDHNNNIWIGTDGGGLNCFNPQTHTFTNYSNSDKAPGIFNNYVLSVAEYLPDVLAVGFHRGGIDLFDVQKQSFAHYAPQGMQPNRLTSYSVNVVYKDSRNNLWLSNDGTGGIYLFDNKSKQFTSFFPDTANKKSIGGSTTFVMYETKAGQFWIGGDNGLDLFDRDKNEFTHHRHDPANKQSLSSNVVLSVAEDKTGNLWVGTDYGLNFFDCKTKIVSSYTEKDGLPNNVIWAIQTDHHGDLWLSTNKGLSKFTPATKTFRNFTVSEGLQSNMFKLKASYQSPAGEMFFGGVNGFNTFYPDSIKDNDFIPPVYITGLQIFNRPVGIGGSSPLKESVTGTKEIVLSYKQSVFTLEFAALNFTHPEKNRYAYKLEGFDTEWNFADDKRAATYTNLNAGTYVFMVKGSNNDGVWNENATTITIIITPPFWLTWWFKLLVFLLIAGSIMGFYLFRMAIIKGQKILLQQKVNEQTLELVQLNAKERKARLEAEYSHAESEMARQEAQVANKELQVKNKELEQFASVASHDLQEPLRTTTGFVELLQKKYKGKLDEKGDQYLSFISDASNRMKVLIKDLLDFSRIGAKTTLQTIDCNVLLKNVQEDIMSMVKETNAVIECGELPVISGYTTEMKLLFQNLLINAIKFRKKDCIPQINIAAKKNESGWQFTVTDNGIGIDKEYSEKIFDIFQRLHSRSEYEGSGIGLSHCKKIVELHHGKIWVESETGKGSTFYFTIP